MGLKDFRIEFTHPGPSVFASQTIRGKVILELSQDKVINCLEIVCCGKGKVQWKESRGVVSGEGNGQLGVSNKLVKPVGSGSMGPTTAPTSVDGTKNKLTSSSPLSSQTIMSVEETYIEERLILLDKSKAELPPPPCDKLLVEKGKWEHSFEFTIPATAPSSFQGPYGHVKYYLEATLSRPSNKRPHVIKIPFTVNGLLDLNKDPKLTNSKTPSIDTYVTELKKLFKGNVSLLSCLICWPSKERQLLNQVGFHLRLHKSLFVPGEYIQFVADMRNMSQTDVSGVTLSLIQETNFYVGDKCRSGLKHTVATAKGPSVASGQSEIWETNPLDSLFLQIPSVPPTNLGTSKIIEVKYFLQLEMEFYGQKNIKGQLPILIGSIPLRSAFRDFVNLKKRSGTDTTKENNSSAVKGKPFGLSMGYPDLPSPTFEEAVCFTPSLDFFTIGNGIGNGGVPPPSHLPDKIQVKPTEATVVGPESGGDDENPTIIPVDSDEEYLSATDKNHKKYDDSYVPLYAKYPTTYAMDS